MGEIQTIKERYSAEVYVESRWREPTLDDLTDEQVSEGVWERQTDIQTYRQTDRQTDTETDMETLHWRYWLRDEQRVSQSVRET